MCDFSISEGEKEWPDGMKSYSLVEKDGVTVLTIELGIPPGYEDTVNQ